MHVFLKLNRKNRKIIISPFNRYSNNIHNHISNHILLDDFAMLRDWLGKTFETWIQTLDIGRDHGRDPSLSTGLQDAT